MYIKIENKDKVTRGEGTQYSIDNYLTKDKGGNYGERNFTIKHRYHS